MNKITKEIIDNFDFEKVEQTMKLLNWGWGIENIIPTQTDLIETATRLIEDAIEDNGKYSYYSTGGFSVYCLRDKFGKGKLFYRLAFNIDYVDSV